MSINHDDLNTLATSPPQTENVTIQGLEKAVLDEKCKVLLIISINCLFNVTVSHNYVYNYEIDIRFR